MPLRSLIVDDNLHFLRAASDLLEREGFVVVGASTSDEALRRAEELRPDVTLVDIDLGDEDGFDVAERLSAANGLEQSSLVLISTYAEKDFTDLIAASPAVGFLAKSDLSGTAICELLAISGEGGRTDPR